MAEHGADSGRTRGRDGEARIIRAPQAHAVPSFVHRSRVGATHQGMKELPGRTQLSSASTTAPVVEGFGLLALPEKVGKARTGTDGLDKEEKGFDIAFRRIRVHKAQADEDSRPPPFPLRRVESLKRAPSRLFQRNLRLAAEDVSSQILDEIIDDVVEKGRDNSHPQLQKLQRAPTQSTVFRSASNALSMLGSRSISAFSEASSRFGIPKQSIVWPDRDRYEPKALILLKLSNPVRLVVIGVTESSSFRVFMMFAILLSSAGLAAEDPHDALYLPEGPFRIRGAVLERINYSCSILFGVELLLNIVAQGFVWGSRTYLADMWNWLDFFVALSGLVDLGGGGGSRFAALRCIRAGRALRAIRFIPDLPLLIELLGQVAGLLFHVLVINVLLSMVFAVVSVQLLAGTLRGQCFHVDSGLPHPSVRPCSVDPHGQGYGFFRCPEPEGCEGCWACVQGNFNPSTRAASFDGFADSWMAAVQMLTLQGWGKILGDVMDAVSPGYSIVFVFYILAGPLFTVQAFVSVLSHQLDTLKDKALMSKLARCIGRWKHIKTTSLPFATWLDNVRLIQETRKEFYLNRIEGRRMLAEQACRRLLHPTLSKAWRQWHQAMVLSSILEPSEQLLHSTADYDPPPVWVRAHRRIQIWSVSKWLERTVLVVVIVSTALMLLQHSYSSTFGNVWGGPRGFLIFHSVLEIGQILCAAAFTLEFLIKVVGLGPSTYLSSRLNCLDSVVVIVCLVELPDMIDKIRCGLEGNDPYGCNKTVAGVQLIRSLRLIRLVKILRSFPMLQKQVLMALRTFRSAVSVLVLLGVVVFVFTVLGMTLLGGRLYDDVTSVQDLALGAVVYFRYPGDTSLSDRLPGHPARIRWANVSSHTVAPILLEPLYAEYLYEHFQRVSDQSQLIAARLEFLDSRRAAAVVTPCADPAHKGCRKYLWAAVGSRSSLPGLPLVTAIAYRSNFDSFGTGAFTVLQVLTKAGWSDVMWRSVRALGFWIITYFYLLLFFGHYVCLNVMASVCVVCYGTRSERKITLKEMQKRRKKKKAETKPPPKETKLMRSHTREQLRMQAREHLVHTASDHRWEIRSESVRLLAAVTDEGDATVIDAVLVRLTDQHATVRAEAIRSLAKISPGSISLDFEDVPIEIRRSLGDSSRIVREAAAGALSQVCLQDDARAIQDLINILEDEVAAVRAAAIKSLAALASVGDKYVTQSIVDRLDGNTETSPEVLDAAYLAIQILQGGTVSAAQRQALDDRRQMTKLEKQKPSTSKEAASKKLAIGTGPQPPVAQTMRDIDGGDRNDLLEVSELEEVERVHQAKLVGLMQQALEENMFDLDHSNVTLHNPKQRVMRYAVAAAQVETVLQKLREEVEQLQRDMDDARHQQRNQGWYAQEIAKVHSRMADLEQHLLVLESPNSLFCLPPLHPLRAFCWGAVRHRYFSWFINFSILVSCTFLAVERPNIPEGERAALDGINTSLNIIFSLEFLVRVIAQSFNLYIQDHFNKLDLLIVIGAVVDEIFTRTGLSSDAGAVKVLRVLRGLRPLRALRHVQGLRVVSGAMVNAAYRLLTVACIASTAFCILGVLGMQILSGTMQRCTDPLVFSKDRCEGQMPNGAVRIWENSIFGFDWIGESILTVFVVSSLDFDWNEYMYEAVDSTGELTGPWQWYSPGLGVYYLGLVLIGGFLIAQMFTAVFVEAYSTALEREHEGKVGLVDEKIWRDEVPLLFTSKQRRKQIINEFLTHKGTEAVIALAVLFQLVSMFFESHKAHKWQTDLVVIANFFFNGVFTIEAALKIYCWKVSVFVLNDWQKLEWFLVISSYVLVAVENSNLDLAFFRAETLRFLRLFRAARILRSFKMFQVVRGMQQISRGLIKSVHTLLNLIFLLCILFFVFGVMGVAFYGHMCVRGQEATQERCLFMEDANLIPPYTSFANIGTAFLTLFRIASGDEWAGLANIYGVSTLANPRVPGYLELAAQGIRTYRRATSTHVKAQALNQIRGALRGCASGRELRELGEMGLLDCEDGTQCLTTCGHVTVYVLLPLFVAVSNFVLINLVISVLREEIGRTLHRSKLVVRGTRELTGKKFALIWTTWRQKCFDKTRWHREIERLKALRRQKKKLEVAGVVGAGPRFTEQALKWRKAKAQKAIFRASTVLNTVTAAKAAQARSDPERQYSVGELGRRRSPWAQEGSSRSLRGLTESSKQLEKQALGREGGSREAGWEEGGRESLGEKGRRERDSDSELVGEHDDDSMIRPGKLYSDQREEAGDGRFETGNGGSTERVRGEATIRRRREDEARRLPQRMPESSYVRAQSGSVARYQRRARAQDESEPARADSDDERQRKSESGQDDHRARPHNLNRTADIGDDKPIHADTGGLPRRQAGQRTQTKSVRRRPPTARTWETGEAVGVLDTENDLTQLQPAEVRRVWHGAQGVVLEVLYKMEVDGREVSRRVNADLVVRVGDLPSDLNIFRHQNTDHPAAATVTQASTPEVAKWARRDPNRVDDSEGEDRKHGRMRRMWVPGDDGAGVSAVASDAKTLRSHTRDQHVARTGRRKLVRDHSQSDP